MPGGRSQALLSQLKHYVDEGDRTDYIMPVLLPFIPALLYPAIPALFYFVSFSVPYVEGSQYPGISDGIFVTIALILVATSFAVSIYVLYRWIVRRNDHFKRINGMYATIVELAKELRFSRAISLESRYRELSFLERERSVGVNIILSIIIPFYVLYVCHFLNKDFHNHSRIEKLFLADLFDEIRERQPSFARRYEEHKDVPDRSTLLYLILMLITGGLFLIYWVYTVTNDPNEHFRSHRIIDREILSAFEKLIASSDIFW